MNALWIILLVLVALLVFTRLRTKRKLRGRTPPKLGPRVTGSQINAYLHPRMSAACLFDHGVQFGKGFRRKEGPELPHDEACRCESVPFSFTSSEVFNGALRGVTHVKSTIEGLPQEQAQRLVEGLKAAESNPLPADEEAYLSAVVGPGPPARLREEIRAFLGERYRHLQQRRQAEASEPAADQQGAQGMDTAESS
jgi:hypothetical protein